MKQNMKRLTIIATIITLALVSFAQSQPTIGYQAVVRTSDGNLICNRQITMRVWILAGNAGGNAVYVENHYAATDKNGLFSIEIGRGETSDNWSAIDWSHGPYFVKTEIDPHGGINYSIVSVNQMLSVPYAMYADMAGNMPDVSGYISEETDPTVSAWAKTDSKPAYDYSEITNTPEIPTLPANVSAFANDARYITLSDVPAQVNSNWNATSGTSQILNKPTRVSQFTNDVGYLTSVTETQTIADAAALGNSINAQLKNLANPTDAQDAITKSYLDSITALLDSVFEAQSIALDEIPLIVNGFVDERDGNHYDVVKIGSQIWMAENLRYEGDIPLITSIDPSETAHRDHPNGDASNLATYGYLYNWIAVMNGASSSSTNPSGVQGICPNGWHLPSISEWTQLYNAEGGQLVAGPFLAGNESLWNSGELTESEDFGSSGFNALPLGYGYGSYQLFGESACFWSSDYNDNNDHPWSIKINYNSSTVLESTTNYIYYCISVRCVKN